ncbi:hypothetical protein C8D88_11669 [Lentzea atacamensis]|uniref:Uncharacterized protein n=1 Tax=Lentzea atacamensis TaxID=531938 RepID=A0A316HNS4_9PSEU|nr:hypothetical protein [Lentzea atacamensis]PWK81658.1 hypothetical protein C8D88_11669 [Lentzea atacamensis]
MAAHVILTCDCAEYCGEYIGGLSVENARDNAVHAGWDRDTVNGSTVDFAPGHGPNRRAA